MCACVTVCAYVCVCVCVPDAIKIITGDSNHCDLETTLPNRYEQYVTCATRRDNIIDLFYRNVQNAYKFV